MRLVYFGEKITERSKVAYCLIINFSCGIL